MKVQFKQGRRRWVAVVVAAAIVTAGGYLALSKTGVLAQGLLPGASSQSSPEATTVPTVTIQPADVTSTAVSASGNLALVDERSVALGVDGVVEKIVVNIVDQVNAGDLILQLDTTALERAVAQAQLQVDSAKIALADLKTPATDAEIAKAEANLRDAQENLAEVKAGPSAEEIAAARSTLAAAQASYSELQAGPSAAELTQLSADMKKAEIALASAQGAYDKIAWQGSAGMSSEASALQEATIDYESAKAAYEEATAAANGSDLQSSVSTIQDAQVKLNDLLNSPTDAEVAASDGGGVDECERSAVGADIGTLFRSGPSIERHREEIRRTGVGEADDEDIDRHQDAEDDIEDGSDKAAHDRGHGGRNGVDVAGHHVRHVIHRCRCGSGDTASAEAESATRLNWRE